jgi:hypothetical protein
MQYSEYSESQPVLNTCMYSELTSTIDRIGWVGASTEYCVQLYELVLVGQLEPVLANYSE